MNGSTRVAESGGFVGYPARPCAIGARRSCRTNSFLQARSTSSVSGVGPHKPGAPVVPADLTAGECESPDSHG